MCEISLFVGLFLLGLFSLGFISPGDIYNPQLIVALPVAVGAGVVVITSVLSYFFAPSKHLKLAAASNYLLLLFVVGLLLVLTDPTRSPFIALWMLVCVFAGLFGWRMLWLVFLLTNTGLGVGLLIFGYFSLFQDGLLLLSAYELPLLASWLIWHRQNKPGHAQNDRAYKDLVRELSHVANKSEIVINAIADGVIAVDGQGAIQLINPAAQKIIGWGKQDALKLSYTSVLKLLDSKEQPVTHKNDPVQQVLQTNSSVVNNDLMLETISGRKLLVSVLASPISQAGAGVIIVFRDITTEKQTEREQAEFISTASHEMRTPVATIEGYLGLTLNPNTATIDERAQSYLIKAKESVSHLGQLFQDLLDISKVDDHRMANNPTVTDLVFLSDEIVAGFQPKAKAKNLVLLYKPTIETQATKKLSPVYYADIDNTHYREVLSNLVDNAIKYTKEGNVTVNVTGDDEHVYVSVHDTGIGIPPEDITHLFQKFYRVNNSQTQSQGGTGLGLYLCRKLVESMNGRVWVESTLGEGSTFNISFQRVGHEDAIERIERSGEQII